MYLEKVARLKNATLGIVIDDHRSGASSNRNAIFTKLQQLKERLPLIAGIKSKDISFNGYNSKDCCYVISSDDLL